MGKRTEVKLVPVPAELHSEIVEMIKNISEIVTITEFVRKAIKILLLEYKGRNN